MVLLTLTSKASTPPPMDPTGAGIMSRLSVRLTYHFLMVPSYLAALCAFLSWPLLLGLMILVVLGLFFPLVPLLVEESLPFILSPLHVDGSVTYLLIKATCAH